MTVSALKAAIWPALQEILTKPELMATSVRVTHRDAPLMSLGDDEFLDDLTLLQIFTLGESYVRPTDGEASAVDVYVQIRSDLQDFVAESSFGWGQLRP